MGIVFRQSIKGSIAIFGGILLGALYTYYSSVVFSKTELGGIRNLVNQGAVIQLFFLAGCANLLNPYILQWKQGDERRSVLITIALAVPLLLAILSCVPYFLLKDAIISKYQVKDRPFVASFYTWLLPLSSLLSYMTLLEYYLNSQFKAAVAMFMREVVLRLCFLSLLTLYAFHYIDLNSFVVGTVVIHTVPLAFLIYFARQTVDFRLSTNWKALSKAEYRSILHYAWFHLLTSATLNLVSYVDAIMLGPLSRSGLDDVAVYLNAQFLISIMYAPFRAMTAAAFPKLAEAYLAGAKDHMHDLFNRSGLNMLIMAIAMWLIVVCNLHNAVAILPGGYSAIAPIVIILSLGRVVDMGTGLNTELISVTRYYKFNFRLAFMILLSVIVFDRIFIPHYGIYGAAWVASLTMVAANIIKMLFLYRNTGLHPFSRHTLTILLAGAVSFGVSFTIPHLTNPVADACVRSAVLLLIYTLLLLVFRPSPDLHAYLTQVRKNKRLF